MDRVARLREIDDLISSGDYALALELLEEMEGEMRAEGGGPQLFSVLWRKGWILYRMGKPEGALRWLKEAEEVLPTESLTPNLLRTLAFVLSLTGTVLHVLKRFGEAKEYHGRSLTVLEGLRGYVPDEVLLLDMAKTLNNRGNAAVGEGNYEEALAHYGEALSILEALPTRETTLHLKANIHYNVGSLYYYLNDVAEACGRWKEALRLYGRLCEERGREEYCKNARKLRKSVERNCAA